VEERPKPGRVQKALDFKKPRVSKSPGFQKALVSKGLGFQKALGNGISPSFGILITPI
jgi:hypothetical protein